MKKVHYVMTGDVLASREKRFLNLVIDYIAHLILSSLLGVVTVLIGVALEEYAVIEFIENMNRMEEYLLGAVISLLYYILFEGIATRSLGKYITQTKVVLEDGTKPGWDVIIIRNLCRLVPFEAFSFLGSDARGWHDTWSKTYVVDVKKWEAKMEMEKNLSELGTVLD